MSLKIVNSFDIFDTLIGRIYGPPDCVFDAVGEFLQYRNYKNIRRLAEAKSDGTWDSIWEEFESLSHKHRAEVENIKSLEWEIEKEYSFPILNNTRLVKTKDILVSDMYLSEEMIKELLTKNSIVGYSKIYVSPNGKRRGYIWSKIAEDGYKIVLHTGDNETTDILSAKKHNILSCQFNPNYTNQEIYLINNNEKKIGNLLRILRLSNIYEPDSNEHISWNNLCGVVAICKIIFSSSNKLDHIKKFPELYINHTHGFHKHLDADYYRIVPEIDAFAGLYIDRLKILYHDFIITDDLLFYINQYCKKYI